MERYLIWTVIIKLFIFLPLDHKAIYAARNADRLAEHFYEQGKADAIKDVMAKSKNINSDPRPISEGSSLSNGWKVKAVTGVDASKLKIKKKT